MVGRRHENNEELSDFRPRRCLENETISIIKGKKMNEYTQNMKKININLFVILVAFRILTSTSFFNQKNKNTSPDDCHTARG